MLLWDINKLNTFLNATQVSSQSPYLQILEDLEVLEITNKGETQSVSLEVLQRINNKKLSNRVKRAR